MAAKVVWTKEATEQFDDIFLFLLFTWNEKVASSFIKLADKELRFIQEHPLSFPVFDSKRNIRKVVIHRNVSLFYRFLEEHKTIEIISFWDNRQNPENLLP